MKAIVFRATALSALVITSACGGSGSTDTNSLLLDPTDVTVTPVAATGSDNLSAAGSFPFYYVLNNPGEPQSTIQTGIGIVTVTDANTMSFMLEDGSEMVALTSPDGLNFDGTVEGDSVFIQVLRGSGTTLGYLDSPGTDDFGLTGIYGFETEVAALPGGNATYDSSGLARAYIATEDEPDLLQLTQEPSTNPALTVAFDTGEVTGTLFDGTAPINFNDDGPLDDTLNVQVDIANGSISDGVLSGEITLVATVDEAGGDMIDLLPNVSQSAVDGRVFGASGNVIGGTFEAVTDFDTGEEERINGAIGGTFFTVD